MVAVLNKQYHQSPIFDLFSTVLLGIKDCSVSSVGNISSASSGGGLPYIAWKGVIFKEVWKEVLYHHSERASP
jgi:hypothetical protein